MFLPVVSGLLDVTRAGNGQFEGVNVESLLIGVGQETDKVVLLEALGVVLVVNEGARGGRVPAGDIKTKISKEPERCTT